MHIMRNTLISISIVAAASVNAAVIIKRQDISPAVLTPQLAPGWTTLGCYSDTQANRTLANLVNIGQTLDNQNCQQLCATQGYTLAGTEEGQCYCDNSINSLAVLESPSDCNVTCPADQTQPCGAADRINVFAFVPQQDYDVPGWTFYGCLTDDVSRRALGHYVIAPNMTAQVCAETCGQEGYTLSGVEWTSECYCDNYVQNNQTLADQSSCDMPCAGDPTQACGGSGRLDLFYLNGSPPQAQVYASHALKLPSGWTGAGCYSDAVGSRALADWIVGPSTGMTVEYCVSGCAAANYTYAGLENQDECYCGLSIDNNQTAVQDGCTAPCSGDNSEICGGANRLSLYKAGPPICNNQGLQYAIFDNTYPNLASGYPAFQTTEFRVAGFLLYQGTTSTIGAYSTCSSNSVIYYNSGKQSTCQDSAANHRGYLYAPITGTYTFSVSQVDDIVLLWTGSAALTGYTRSSANLVVNYGTTTGCNDNYANGWLPGCGTYTINLTAGQYLPFRVLFGQSTGALSFEMSITAPDGTVLLSSSTPYSPYIVQNSCDIVTAPPFPHYFGHE